MFVIGYSLYSLLGIRQIGNNQSTFALFDMWPEMNRMIVLMIIFQFLLLLLQIRPSSQNERERFDVLSTLYAQKLSVIDGNFGKNYTNQINSNSTIIYKFKYSEFKNKVLQIRWNDEDISRNLIEIWLMKKFLICLHSTKTFLLYLQNRKFLQRARIVEIHFVYIYRAENVFQSQNSMILRILYNLYILLKTKIEINLVWLRNHEVSDQSLPYL
jgi:hypothetical protein